MDIFQAMRVFVRVVETGSFTAAAQALGYSTAQTSRLLSELEASLQARLLQRSTRRLALTEVGARYLERCRLILSEVEDANAEAGGAHLTPRGHLRVQSTTGIGIQLLAPLVARYAQLYPQVNVDLTLSQRQPDLLEEGHDVVITLSSHLPDSELVGQALGTISSVISVPLVPNTGIRCRSDAYFTSSTISGRVSGSPPEKIMILNPALAISRRSFFASSVFSSSSALQPASR